MVECPHHVLDRKTVPPSTTVRVMPSWSATRWHRAAPTWVIRALVAVLSE